MKTFKTFFLCMIVFFSSMCSSTKAIHVSKADNMAADSIYSKLIKVNYVAYTGKTIGYLLDNEKINNAKFNFVDSEYRCLEYVNFSFGHNVFLQVYCPKSPKYIRMCDATFPTSWNLEDFKKEKITEIILVRKFPILLEVTVFPRQ